MADIKAKFGTSNQAITCTLNSLTNGSAQQSAVVDNSTNLFLDALVMAIIVAGASGVGTSGYIEIFAYASVDGGTNYTEGATGSNASITLTTPTNLRFVGMINVVAVNTTYKAGPFSVAQAFGGQLPEKWGLVFRNQTGGTLAAAGNSVFYQGVLAQN